MSHPSPNNAGPRDEIEDFQRQAETPSPGIVAEFLEFLLQSKKWWLIPIIVVLLLTGLLVILGATGAGPFIYTTF